MLVFNVPICLYVKYKHTEMNYTFTVDDATILKLLVKVPNNQDSSYRMILVMFVHSHNQHKHKSGNRSFL